MRAGAGAGAGRHLGASAARAPDLPPGAVATWTPPRPRDDGGLRTAVAAAMRSRREQFSPGSRGAAAYVGVLLLLRVQCSSSYGGVLRDGFSAPTGGRPRRAGRARRSPRRREWTPCRRGGPIPEAGFGGLVFGVVGARARPGARGGRRRRARRQAQTLPPRLGARGVPRASPWKARARRARELVELALDWLEASPRAGAPPPSARDALEDEAAGSPKIAPRAGSLLVLVPPPIASARTLRRRRGFGWDPPRGRDRDGPRDAGRDRGRRRCSRPDTWMHRSLRLNESAAGGGARCGDGRNPRWSCGGVACQEFRDVDVDTVTWYSPSIPTGCLRS